ncbi:AEC family transporter [Sneathiella sp. P13V-1]|uniref:AEC family transporter n=1 Tax=Sneathiella sp. P13V-1 TaxID=2697366 RepID=UPI00187B39F0|nr:AEC family transporter [Sneathiella sp. P13V-1]MBE7638480.1 AEC family transporter [Sneathiella sp. P13V-1]
MIEILFNVIAPVLICAGIGFYWAKSGRSFHMETVTGLVTNIGAPTLIFSTLINLKMELSSFLEFGLLALYSLIAFLVIGISILKALRMNVRDYLPALAFPNTGNMGVPLCLFAFGEEGLAFALAFFTVYAILQFTLGVYIASGSSSLSQLAKTPLLYAVLVAMTIKLTGTVTPEWINDTTSLLGGITIPMMLMALGVSLANLSVQHLGRATVLSVIRLLLGFGVGLGLATIFGLEGTAKGVLIIECTMPVAVFNYLFALRYNRATGEIAGTVLISTLLSFLTLPILLTYLLV